MLWLIWIIVKQGNEHVYGNVYGNEHPKIARVLEQKGKIYLAL